MDSLKAKDWLGSARAWWPDYLFRIDNITSAASILNDGKLLSRKRASEMGKMISDSASPGVIAHTSDIWKDYVRLYFRPRTPTQYHSEGIRPSHQYGLGACCPVPVFILFNSREIMTRDGALFSTGNLASSNAEVGDDAKFLRRIPFEDVYHNDSFGEEARGRIVFHRHAEVIYPRQLDLDAVKGIYCRTSAERETLLALLTPTAANRWSNSIGLSSKLNLHYRWWTFLEEVDLAQGLVTLSFNPSSRTPGPFRIRVEMESRGATYSWSAESYMANRREEIGIERSLDEYTVVVKLDSDLIFKSAYRQLVELV